MRKIILSSLTAAVFATQAFAATLSMDTVLGTTVEAVTASLAEMGYEVRKSEMEDGKIEVYFVGNNQMGEVYVDARTGKPMKLEIK
ncbi:PepSY domain-containing protein [Marivita sp.]|uniref:PepSY domain-containing protein n=1 Tax=Marivita sp. TaxID=2003365 RepID=UPI0025B93BAC|nr:PepSY domain-containing protein [Marivita sp.]